MNSLSTDLTYRLVLSAINKPKLSIASIAYLKYCTKNNTNESNWFTTVPLEIANKTVVRFDSIERTND